MFYETHPHQWGCIPQPMHTLSIEVRQPHCENICMIYIMLF